jgi:hypothetical protein
METYVDLALRFRAIGTRIRQSRFRRAHLSARKHQFVLLHFIIVE